MLLSDYNTQVRRLLHDSSGYWADAELTDYINAARNRVVADTGCNRRIQINYTNTSTETYVFGGVTGIKLTAGGSGYANGTYALGFAGGGGGTGAAGTYTCAGGVVTSVTVTAQGSGYTAAPTVSFPSGGGANAAATAGIILSNTIDVLNVTVIWGSTRIPLDYKPYTQFNQQLRFQQTYQNRPSVFSQYGQSLIYLGPVPDQVYQMEWDTVVMPTVLVNAGDADTIAFPFTDPVPFYAAHLAKFNEQSYEEADRFRSTYSSKIVEATRSSFTRRILNQGS